MNNIHLAKVFNKKDTKTVLDAFSSSFNQTFAIYHADGKLLFGKQQDYTEESPVFVDDELFGWVKGNAKTESIADLIAFLLGKEREKKELARETLGLYKEINLLYNLAEKIKSHLERYVSEKVVHAIMDAGEKQVFSPEKRYISILFSDIRGFTTLCETIDSKEILDHLNTYFENMVDIIFTEQGTINKFVGDMIVALFGAPEVLPNNEKHTVMAAISMQNWLKQTSYAWINQNFKTGIGINSGEVIIGNVGSPKHMDYTAIGDEVNLASRLQSLATGGQILVSRSIYDATKDDFDYRYQGALPIKGKERPVDVYEVVY